MSGTALDMMWVGTWVALGILIGAFAVWSAMSKKIDAHARSLSMAAHEVSKINPRGEDMTPEEFAEAASRKGYHVIRPVSSTTQDSLGD